MSKIKPRVKQARARSAKRFKEQLDGYRCRICGEDNKRRLTAHHLIGLRPKDDRIANLVTLCAECHKIVDSTRFQDQKRKTDLRRILRSRLSDDEIAYVRWRVGDDELERRYPTA